MPQSCRSRFLNLRRLHGVPGSVVPQELIKYLPFLSSHPNAKIGGCVMLSGPFVDLNKRWSPLGLTLPVPMSSRIKILVCPSASAFISAPSPSGFGHMRHTFCNPHSLCTIPCTHYFINSNVGTWYDTLLSIVIKTINYKPDLLPRVLNRFSEKMIMTKWRKLFTYIFGCNSIMHWAKCKAFLYLLKVMTTHLCPWSHWST